ncbi:MAG TPA: putative sugar O-methyltransferase [Bacteroidia bacterium]|nr:putative sugar O-methyltransferase [Bacteroidia bacterium]
MSRFTNDGMWAHWAARVAENKHQFAKSPFFVEQDSVPEERFRALAEKVALMEPYDPDGMTRDAEFGARVVDTCLGPVTRMWLESMVEIDFLYRNLPELELPTMKVLDIGAGYGRLAAALDKNAYDVRCVDAVPISTEISRGYLKRFAPSVHVFSIEEFEDIYTDLTFDLCVNIHSFNECKLSQIENWLKALEVMQVPYLFTVSHGQMDHNPEPSYRSYGDDHPSFRPLLEARYELIAEESLGLSPSPHALWLRRK